MNAEKLEVISVRYGDITVIKYSKEASRGIGEKAARKVDVQRRTIGLDNIPPMRSFNTKRQ